jgi:hypothetical protein
VIFIPEYSITGITRVLLNFTEYLSIIEHDPSKISRDLSANNLFYSTIRQSSFSGGPEPVLPDAAFAGK